MGPAAHLAELGSADVAEAVRVLDSTFAADPVVQLTLDACRWRTMRRCVRSSGRPA